MAQAATTTTLARLLAIACCLTHPLAGGGCASHRAGSAQDLTPRTGPATLHVKNSNWSDIRIYVTRANMKLRLGAVTSQSSAIFEIAPDLLTESGSVMLVAIPVAGWSYYSTSLTGVSPGDELELTVENLLQHSHLVIR